jgi:hypothetical protein
LERGARKSCYSLSKHANEKESLEMSQVVFHRTEDNTHAEWLYDSRSPTHRELIQVFKRDAAEIAGLRPCVIHSCIWTFQNCATSPAGRRFTRKRFKEVSLKCSFSSTASRVRGLQREAGMKLRTYTSTWPRFCAATELQMQSTPRKMADALSMRMPR